MENNKSEDYRIWPMKKFEEEIWAIFPEGNKEWTYNVIVANVNNHNYTFELIKKKFNEYVKSLTPFQNGKYTSRDKKIKTLETFLNEDLYKLDFVTNITKSNPIRDWYLYGNEE